jgi:FkbM family methyltransferase
LFKNFIKRISILKRKILYRKISYSFGGVDLLINYIFKDKKKGVYVDVGSQHPISNNNTYLLFKKGWTGVNIDLDPENIKLFNLCRKNDLNVCAALSSKIGEIDLFFYHDGSPINTVEKIVADSHKKKFNEIKKIKTTTLNLLLEANNIEQINYLNIDVEGHELHVLKGFDLAKYQPDTISVEYLDLKMKKLEFKNNNLNSVLSSELYKHMIENNYSLINWSHADLIFINNQLKN